MRRSLYRAVVLALFMLAAGCGAPDPARKVNVELPSGTGFVPRTLQAGGKSYRYRIFVPRDYTAQRRYPAIIFLHGLGEAGSDGVAPTTVGLGPAIARRRETFDFIAIFPQSRGSWKGADAVRRVIDTLDDVRRDYAIDEDRVSLTGLSTGGEGTWRIGAAHRDRFAALVPVCSYRATDAVPRLIEIPIWAFHNDRDIIISVNHSRSMARAIEAAGGDIRYTEFSQFGHNCWDQAYGMDELYEWLKAQRRRPLTRRGN